MKRPSRSGWALALVATFFLRGCQGGGGTAPPAEQPRPSALAGASTGAARAEGLGQFAAEEPAKVLLEVPSPLAPGARAELIVRFEPRPHILVPIYPPAFVDSFEALGALSLPRGRVPARVLTPEEEEKGRLSYYKGPPPEVRVPLRVPPDAAPGAYPVAGNAHYFYCNDEGGFCARRSARVEGVIDVVAPEAAERP